MLPRMSMMQLAVQAVGYAALVILGFLSSMPVVRTKKEVHGQCVLYGGAEQVDYKIYLHSGSESNCNYVIGVHVLFSVLYAAAMFVYSLYAIYRARQDLHLSVLQSVTYSGVQLALHVTVTFLCLVAGCVVTVGFKYWCSHLQDAYGKHDDLTCKEISSHFKNSNFVDFHKHLSLAIVSGWLTTVVWLSVTLTYAVRFYRLKKAGSSKGIYNPAPGDGDRF